MKTRQITSIAMFVSLITVGGLISVPVPFTQVQLSFQTVFVIAAGLFLGGRDGALCSIIYLFMGLVGLPVFTQGGGAAYVFMPSFGYLIGFPVGALVAGTICSRAHRATSRRAFLAAVVGMIPVYVIGMTYQVAILYFYSGVALEAALAGLPAVAVLGIKDACLCALIAYVYPSVKKALRTRAKEKTRALKSLI